MILYKKIQNPNTQFFKEASFNRTSLRLGTRFPPPANHLLPGTADPDSSGHGRCPGPQLRCGETHLENTQRRTAPRRAVAQLLCGQFSPSLTSISTAKRTRYCGATAVFAGCGCLTGQQTQKKAATRPGATHLDWFFSSRSMSSRAVTY